MRKPLPCHRLLPLLLAAALLPAARATDLAQAMPADTAVYIGWSQLADPNSPEYKNFEKHADQIREMVAKQADEKAAALLQTVFRYMPVLQTGSFGLGLFDVTLAGDVPDIQIALVIDAGAATAGLAEAPDKLMAEAGAEAKSTAEDVSGVSLRTLTLPDSPFRLYWGVHKSRFLLTLGRTAAGRVIETLNGGKSLADNPEVQFDRKKIGADVTGRHFAAFVDVRRVISRAKELVTEKEGALPPMVDQVLSELGINAVRSKYLHVGMRANRAYFAAFAHADGERRGLLKFWDQKPLTEDDLKLVPKDAYWAEITNFDLAALWREAMRIVEALAPDQTGQVEGGLAMVQQMVGFSVPDDLLPAFGDTWAIFDAPSHGGLLLTGAVLVNDVPDPDKLQSLLERLVEFGQRPLASGKVGLALKKTRYAEHDVHYLLITGIPVPVSPAWTFVDKRWVFGLYPQTVEAALKQVDPKTRGESLLDNPEFKTLRANLPKEVQSVGYLNTRYLARLVYPLLRGASTAAASMLGAKTPDADLMILPPLDDYVKDVTDYVGTTSTDADGILYTGTGSGAPLLLIPAAAALGTGIVGVTTLK